MNILKGIATKFLCLSAALFLLSPFQFIAQTHTGGGGSGCSPTGSSILAGNGSGGCTNVTTGSGITYSGGTLSATGSGGTVSTLSVVSANGLAGTVANPTTTPAITLSTSITGILKGNGTAIAAGTAGTDYVAPGTATTFTAPQTFNNTSLNILGSSTGYTTFTSANSSATNYLLTLPAITDTVTTNTATQTLSSKTLTTPTVNGYTECADTPTITSGAVTISNTTCTFHKLSFVQNTTITLPSPVAGQSYTIQVCYGGVYTVTWAGGGTLSWAGGSAPTATSVNGKCDFYVFMAHDTTYTYGQDGGRNFTGT